MEVSARHRSDRVDKTVRCRGAAAVLSSTRQDDLFLYVDHRGHMTAKTKAVGNDLSLSFDVLGFAANVERNNNTRVAPVEHVPDNVALSPVAVSLGAPHLALFDILQPCCAFLIRQPCEQQTSAATVAKTGRRLLLLSAGIEVLQVFCRHNIARALLREQTLWQRSLSEAEKEGQKVYDVSEVAALM